MASFHDAVRRAAKGVGGQARLASLVGCAQSEISRLSTSAQSISPEIAVGIVKATKGTEEEIRLVELLPQSVIDVLRDELQRELTGAAA